MLRLPVQEVKPAATRRFGFAKIRLVGSRLSFKDSRETCDHTEESVRKGLLPPHDGPSLKCNQCVAGKFDRTLIPA